MPGLPTRPPSIDAPAWRACLSLLLATRIPPVCHFAEAPTPGAGHMTVGQLLEVIAKAPR